MDIWKILGKKHAAEVLIEVYRTPGIIQNQIADKREEGSGSKRQRLLELEAAGLVRTDSSSENWTAIRYFVTDEGARVAKGLLQIEPSNRVE